MDIPTCQFSYIVISHLHADYHGKELAHMDSDQTEEGIMYSDIPVKGIKVLYPILGDLLGWLSVIMMFVLIGLVFFKKKWLSLTN